MFVESPLLVVDPLFFCFQILFGFSPYSLLQTSSNLILANQISQGLALRPAFAPRAPAASAGSGDLQRQHRRSGRYRLGQNAATAAGVESNDARSGGDWDWDSWLTWLMLVKPRFFNWGYCRYPTIIPYYYWDIYSIIWYCISSYNGLWGFRKSWSTSGPQWVSILTHGHTVIHDWLFHDLGLQPQDSGNTPFAGCHGGCEKIGWLTNIRIMGIHGVFSGIFCSWDRDVPGNLAVCGEWPWGYGARSPAMFSITSSGNMVSAIGSG